MTMGSAAYYGCLWGLIGWGLLGWMLVALALAGMYRLMNWGPVGLARRLDRPVRAWREWRALRRARNANAEAESSAGSEE
jgi:hypothetical protein